MSATSPRELGFGLALAPNAMTALRELGLADVVRSRAHTPTRGEVRRPDGTVLKRAELPSAESMLGGPTVIALRPALHGALLDAVGMEAITLGAEATGFTQHGDRVTLHLADGARVEGDVLIGADGANSVLRRTLNPSEPPAHWSRIVAVRGGVHGVVHHLGGLSGIYYTVRASRRFSSAPARPASIGRCRWRTNWCHQACATREPSSPTCCRNSMRRIERSRRRQTTCVAMSSSIAIRFRSGEPAP